MRDGRVPDLVMPCLLSFPLPATGSDIPWFARFMITTRLLAVPAMGFSRTHPLNYCSSLPVGAVDLRQTKNFPRTGLWTGHDLSGLLPTTPRMVNRHGLPAK